VGETTPNSASRRDFLSKGVGFFMAGGLLAGYGSLAGMAARFLYPARKRVKGWLYVAQVARMKKGDQVSYKAPDGADIAVARQASVGTVDDFIALSSTCPHLGCKVHWEGHNERFFCPCHNGAFNPSGVATSGPPAEAKQSLSRYPLKIENGLLYIEVPLGKLSGGVAH